MDLNSNLAKAWCSYQDDRANIYSHRSRETSVFSLYSLTGCGLCICNRCKEPLSVTISKDTMLNWRKWRASNAGPLFPDRRAQRSFHKAASQLAHHQLHNASYCRTTAYCISLHPGMIKGHRRLSHSPKSH